MFQTLTQNLTGIFNKLRGYGALTEEHIDIATERCADSFIGG
jgi:signal recognition particle GTPase